MNNHDMQDSAIAAPAAGGLGGAGSAMRRIGIFYDGTHFFHISNFYNAKHEHKARLSFRGIHAFVQEEVARQEGVEKRFCRVVDAHYFRGRLGADQAQESKLLYSERQFDEVLIREGITTHFLPLAKAPSGGVKEKGVDVWFALEAFELAILKRFDVCVLVTGDRDFVPLVRKLHTLGSRVMLLAWNLDNGKTTTSQALINEVTYPVLMHELIDNPPPEREEIIDGIFMPKSSPSEQHSHELPDQEAPVEAQDEQGMKTGTIYSYFQEKGYGFILPEGCEDTIFFHINDSEDVTPTDLVPGTAVSFYLGRNDKGPAAFQISLL